MYTSKITKSFDSLVENYQKLPEIEQLLMRLLGVLLEPVKVPKMNAAFKPILASRGEQSMQKVKLQGLVRDELLCTKNSNYWCNPLLVSFLMDEAVKLGEFDRLSKQAQYLQSEPIPYDEIALNKARNHGKFLRGLYAGDIKAVMELLQINDPYEIPKDYMCLELVSDCAAILIPDSFQRLALPLKYQVMRPSLTHSLKLWGDRKIVFQLLHELVEAEDVPSPLMALHAEQCLVRGLWDSAQDSIAKLEAPKAAPLQAALSFLRGDPESETHAKFKQALKAIRKHTGKRNAEVEGLSGIIYILTLLRNPQSGDEQLIKNQLRAAKDNFIEDTFSMSMIYLGHATDMADQEMLRAYRKEHDDNDRLALLFLALITYWNGYDLDGKFLKKLQVAHDEAQVAGLEWFAQEASSLLIAVGAKQADSTKTLEPKLLGLISRTEEWERSLQALKLVHQPRQGKRIENKPNQSRIVWFVSPSYYDYEFTAKEQKLNKSGLWSSGRKIALRRLAENNISLNLTEADLKICKHIWKSYDYAYYNDSLGYRLSGAEVLPDAIGHPLIFDDDSGDPIEMIAGKVELTVEDHDENILLMLNPFPDMDTSSNIVVNEEHGRWTIYEFTSELIEVAEILGSEGLQVPRSAQDQVLESISSIASILTIHSNLYDMGLNTADEVAPDTRLQVQIRPGGEGLRLSFYTQPIANGPLVMPGQGHERIFTQIDGKPFSTLRKLEAESEQLDAVLDACTSLCQTARNDWSWDSLEDALEGLLTLKSLGDDIVLNWPEGEALKVSAPMDSSRMSVSLRQHTNWFEVDGELRIDERQVHSMSAMLELLRNSNSKGRFVAMKDGQFLALTDKLRQQLEVLSSISHKGRINTFGIHSLESSVDGMEIDADDSWQLQLDRLRKARELDPEMPSTVEAELRDYQMAGYKWLRRLAEWGAGACLADDMGLGKTLQALALLVQRAPQGPALVLAPTSVCTNWLEEAQRFTPTLNVIRFGVGKRTKTLEALGSHDVLVCSYGLLQSESKALQAIHWTSIVADEAQAFKNAATKRSRAVMGLNGDFKMIATGTPIENHLGELWNLFAFINPGLLGTREAFNKKFAYPIENQKDRQVAATLRQLVQPFILRRLKSEVLKELPALTEITVHVDLSEDESALYEALRREATEQMADSDLSPGERRFQALAKITRLRRAVCNPNLVLKDAKLPSAKLDAFANILDDLLENRHRALVFSQFVDHLSLVRAYLDDRSITYRYLDGSTPAARRRQEVDAFQSGEAALFLISLKAGGVGLNLTAADYVIHMDPWWNPAVEDQASDRAHRIGQQRPVTVYRLVAANTIEDKIVSLHAHKRDLADRLLEGTDSAARMSLDDMLALLEH